MYFPQGQHIIVILYDFIFSRTFFVSCDHVMLWLILILNPKLRNEWKRKEKKRKEKKRNENENKLSPIFTILTLFPLQGLSFRETEFYFCQFLSSFFKYLFSNFSSSHPYNIFAVYFPSNYSLLKFLSSAIPNFSCLLNSVYILPSNSATISFVFSRSSSFFKELYSAVNFFNYTKHFIIPLTFLLFNIFSTDIYYWVNSH